MELTEETFRALQGETFKIKFTEDQLLTGRLVEIRGLSMNKDDARQPFSLLFIVDQENQYFTQAIFDVFHPDLGSLSVFMVPLGPDASTNKMRYEAVFN